MHEPILVNALTKKREQSFNFPTIHWIGRLYLCSCSSYDRTSTYTMENS